MKLNVVDNARRVGGRWLQ